MDRKTKKRIELLQRRLQLLRQQLAGEKRQRDDPRSTARLEEEIRNLENELSRLRLTGNPPQD